MDLLDGRVVSNFIVQALQNKPISIYGDGTQTRSFCFVTDLILGLVRLLESDQKITGPINLGNPMEFTMLELAQKIIEITNSNSKLRFMPLPKDDPKQRKPDITLAESLLGWKPEIQLNEGLALTIEEFSSRISIS